MGSKLTPDRIKILQVLASERGEGWCTAMWIAEDCDHFFDTPWASSKIPGLVKLGYVERGDRGWYRITDAGRLSLQENTNAG